MIIRSLINNDGTPFKSSELQTLRGTLDSLGDDERTEYRNQNASTIAQHDAVRFLIVSGPGTGKSHLFMDRIEHWYQQDQDANICVTSFVRKLVADLQSDIKSANNLTNEQKDKITVSTLHKFARIIVEKNHGTSESRFRRHFRIIGQSWKEIIWGDVLAFIPPKVKSVYTWKKFEEQLHNNQFEESEDWKRLKETYFKLCQFYNAAGFADVILRATEALGENPNLSENNHFIIDEYQDFNLAEDALINQLVGHPKGLLVVGDDDQVLYDTLKSSKPTLVRDLYNNTDYANGMLPFCSRSSYHITKTANHFIQQHGEQECIEKIYLPLKNNSDEQKLQVIACKNPAIAVDYIKKFVSDNETEIDKRKRQLETGEEKEAFLLILTPAREINFYGQEREEIKSIAAKYQTETRSFSEDYYQLLSYYSLANNSYNNFTFRKVLHYERTPKKRVHELIVEAMRDDHNFCDLNVREIKDALSKCSEVKDILDSKGTVEEKLEQILSHSLISVDNREILQNDMERKAINQEEVVGLEHEDEEEAELEEIEVKQMGAVELVTIVGSKGLSADHVIIIGFDNVNMRWVTKNAFYVAMTRARKSLHLLTALQSRGAKQAHSFLDQLSGDHAEFYSYKKSDHSKSQLYGKQGFKSYLSRLKLHY